MSNFIPGDISSISLGNYGKITHDLLNYQGFLVKKYSNYNFLDLSTGTEINLDPINYQLDSNNQYRVDSLSNNLNGLIYQIRGNKFSLINISRSGVHRSRVLFNTSNQDPSILKMSLPLPNGNGILITSDSSGTFLINRTYLYSTFSSVQLINSSPMYLYEKIFML